jgi:chromosome segregation ATPase
MKQIFLLALFAAIPTRLPAEDGEVEAKLREALRNTMLQVRDAQAKTAEMEGAMVASQAETEKLKKELASARDELVEERNIAANQATELRAELTARDDKILGLEAQGAKWQKDYAALIQQARKMQSEAGQAKARNTVLERAVAEQQVKNIEMKQAADEILDRYAKHSMGATILAREPFISVNRAKLQTIMQDLETRVRAASIPLGANSPPVPKPAAP